MSPSQRHVLQPAAYSVAVHLPRLHIPCQLISALCAFCLASPRMSTPPRVHNLWVWIERRTSFHFCISHDLMRVFNPWNIV